MDNTEKEDTVLLSNSLRNKLAISFLKEKMLGNHDDWKVENVWWFGSHWLKQGLVSHSAEVTI